MWVALLLPLACRQAPAAESGSWGWGSRLLLCSRVALARQPQPWGHRSHTGGLGLSTQCCVTWSLCPKGSHWGKLSGCQGGYSHTVFLLLCCFCDEGEPVFSFNITVAPFPPPFTPSSAPFSPWRAEHRTGPAPGESREPSPKVGTTVVGISFSGHSSSFSCEGLLYSG